MSDLETGALRLLPKYVTVNDIEVEFRIGTKGRGRFWPGVSRDEFIELSGKLSRLRLRHSPVETITVQECFEDGTRTEGGTYMHKTKLESFDVECRGRCVRLCASREHVSTLNNERRGRTKENKLACTRKKFRTSYIPESDLGGGVCRIDMTEVIEEDHLGHRGTRNVFEVEVEIVANASSSGSGSSSQMSSAQIVMEGVQCIERLILLMEDKVNPHTFT
jgi:hypothetical protein